MEIFWMIYFALIGMILGSFYNVVGLRTVKKQSFTGGRSRCPSCETRLNPKDLIPVVSYIFLRGRCRECKGRISPIYPIMEGVTAVLFAFSFYSFGWNGELAAALLLVSLLVIITVSDVTAYLIPDNVLLFFLVMFIIIRFYVVPMDPWWSAAAGGAAGFSILFLLAVISKGGMGGGDVKLYAVIGMALGFSNTMLSLFLASVIGLAAALSGMKRNNWSRKTALPFGPFIASAAVIAYFFGDALLTFYLNFMV